LFNHANIEFPPMLLKQYSPCTIYIFCLDSEKDQTLGTAPSLMYDNSSGHLAAY